MNGNDLPASSVFANVNTAAVGTNWTAFSAEPCIFCRVHNPNSVAVDVAKGGTGAVITVPGYGSKTFYGVRDLSALSVRRSDTSNTQVQVQAEAFHA